MSDEDYKKYKDFAAPKILYSCTEQGVPRSGYAKCNPNGDINKLADCMDAASKNVEKVTVVNYTAGLGGGVTYNEIMNQAKNSCRGDFKILDSKT
jgi:hypothetical protein